MEASETYIDMSDGARIFCRTFGEGEPLLLVHGIMVDADFFIACAQELAKDYRVVTYDRRGYSRSSATDDFSVERQGDDAAEVLRALGIESANVVSCSAGGLTALSLVQRHPEMVKSLVLHEFPLFGTEADPADVAMLQGVDDAVSRGKINRAKLMLIASLGDPDPEARPVPQDELARNMANGDVFLEKEFPIYHALSFEGLAPDPKAIACPVTVGVGRDSTGTFGNRTARDLAAYLGCPVVEFPGRHNCAYDHPAEFAQVVKRIIR